MRRAGSHFSNNLRLRSGIFYLYLLLWLTLGLRLWLPGLYRPDPKALMQADAEFIEWLAVQDSLKSLQENKAEQERQSGHRAARSPSHKPQKSPRRVKQDLNLARAADLQKVRGIGPVLSQRIINFRDALGGFLHESQLLDVYGLSPEVAREAMQRFTVVHPPEITPLNINTATAAELSRLIYLDRQMAEEIVRYRDTHGYFAQTAELAQFLDIPKDRIDRIALYLQF